MKVIGVVGLPASGKGEFSRIASEMGIPVVVMGDVIRAEVRKAGLEATDHNLGEVSGRLRAEMGMDAIARLTIPAVEAQHAPVVVIDGIRGDCEVDLFRDHFAEFTLVGIHSLFENRLMRLASRRRSDDTLSADELRHRDERELGWGLSRALKQADCVLENNGDLSMFTAAVRDFFRSCGCAR